MPRYFMKILNLSIILLSVLLVLSCQAAGPRSQKLAEMTAVAPSTGDGAEPGSGTDTVAEGDIVYSSGWANDSEQINTASGSERQANLNSVLTLIGFPETVDIDAGDHRGSMNAGQSRIGRQGRNPDGSYGPQSSNSEVLEQALSAGGGVFSSALEGWLANYGNARVGISLDFEGHFRGSMDFLLPLYDSETSSFFGQAGFRSMPGDRVIGHLGLGQRFFPSEQAALGYNLFVDQDLSRNHTRGGAGLELWYDWLRLGLNAYAPLSKWKDSKDFNPRLVEERPAKGWDARLTGYLPFYRNLAVTGAYEKWDGDQVGLFGDSGRLKPDPGVWNYGLQWTPVPILTAGFNNRHSGDQNETQISLMFNYRFGQSWEEQTSRLVVPEMRTIQGSRHDFVDRQYDMILAYRDKDRADRIDPFAGFSLALANPPDDLMGGQPFNLGHITVNRLNTATPDLRLDLVVTLNGAPYSGWTTENVTFSGAAAQAVSSQPLNLAMPHLPADGDQLKVAAIFNGREVAAETFTARPIFRGLSDVSLDTGYLVSGTSSSLSFRIKLNAQAAQDTVYVFKITGGGMTDIGPHALTVSSGSDESGLFIAHLTPATTDPIILSVMKSGEATVLDSRTLPVYSAPPSPSLNLPANLTAVANSSLTISGLVVDSANSNAALAGEAVAWSVSGPSGCSIWPATATSEADGRVAAVFTAAAAGAYTVTASLSDGQSFGVAITVSAVTAGNYWIQSIDPPASSVVYKDSGTGENFEVTVQVYDGGAPAGAGVPVVFENTDDGLTFKKLNTVNTDKNGRAISGVRFPAGTTGVAMLRAHVNDGASSLTSGTAIFLSSTSTPNRKVDSISSSVDTASGNNTDEIEITVVIRDNGKKPSVGRTGEVYWTIVDSTGPGTPTLNALITRVNNDGVAKVRVKCNGAARFKIHVNAGPEAEAKKTTGLLTFN